MEHRISDQQQYPRYFRPQSLVTPTSNTNARGLFAHPLRRRNSPDLQNFFNFPATADQTLDASFSCLNLSPSPSSLPSSPDPDFAGDSFMPFSQQQQQRQRLFQSNFNDVTLRSLRFQNGQMVSGVGPQNPAVGLEGFLLNGSPAAVQPHFGDYGRYGGDERLVSGYGGFDFLNNKKQSPSYCLNAQFQTPVPFSSNQNAYNILQHSPASKLQPSQLWNVFTLKDLMGKIIYLAKDQYLWKILHSKFVQPSPEEIEMVLAEVIDHITDLMKNQFGNHFVQKLIAVCNEEQRTRILFSVSKTPSQLIAICLNSHGTRGIQKLIESLSRPQQISLLMATISPGAATLANHMNGHHVIQHCLKHFSTEDNMHILYDIAANCFEVATDRSGCCVLQLCVEKSSGKPKKRLVTEIIAIAPYLSEHPYGNYVLQHMLGLKEPDITADLLRQFEGNYVQISCNKYGSNVVEKCLLESEEGQSTRIIMELVNSANASMILLDPYGNFVIQSALSISKGPARNALLRLVRANSSAMRSNIYGRKVLSWLEKKKIHF